MAVTPLSHEGSAAPRENANTRLTEPAASPLTDASQIAPVSDTLRVRLLSIPHERHAPSTARAGHRPAKRASPGQLRTVAPATMSTIPNAMRRSKFSFNTNHANSAVNTPSAFKRREAPDAGIPVNPSMSSTGPTTPPDRIAPASQGAPLQGSRTRGARLTQR